jgi:capsular polysaccharide biosynthesis protein
MVEFVRENARVEVVGANAVRVAFYGRSPREAVTVAKTTTSEVVNRVRAAAEKQSAKTISLFVDQSEAYRVALEEANTALEAFREDHPETRQLDIAERLLSPPDITASAAVQTEYAQLKLAADHAQTQYDQSLSDLGQARVLSTLQAERYTSGFRTVDEPVEPVSFSMRRMALFVFMSFVAALIIGGTAVVWAEYNDRTLHSGQDVEDALDLPVLTEVPLNDQSARRA